MVEKVKVTFEPGGKSFLLDKGTQLLDVLLRTGTPLETACGGQGTCGKCRVQVNGCTALPDEKEQHHLARTDLSKGIRLACRLPLCEDLTIDIPVNSNDLAQKSSNSLSPGKHSSFSSLAVAVDIGTTAIKIEIINLPQGRTLSHESALNPQRAFGYDVMSRLHSARQQNNAEEMTTLLRDCITRIILQSLGKLHALPQDVTRIIISGNTVMLHFFFGKKVCGLGKYPYRAHSLDATVGKAAHYGLTAFGQTEILGLPAISAYLGGDLVAGMLTTNIHKNIKNTLLIDIGTNSEIIFAGPKGLLATSCAAGPALEGMNIEYGMTASSGAISGVAISDEVTLAVIDNRSDPLGLCGSGIIELMAELLRIGLVDTTGRMHPIKDSLPPSVLKRLRFQQEMPAFYLTDKVYFSQKDVRQVQLAKAAILSGQKVLREMACVSPEEVDSVIIGGEFGRHLKPENLQQLGMLEHLPHATYSSVGNSSLQGARLIAVTPELLEKAKEIALQVEAFHLATLRSYEQLFIQSLEFPGLS